MSYDFAGFDDIELTPKHDEHHGDVYVLLFSKDGIEVPFYVGQSTRFHGRMDDYFWAMFSAATDFKVGMAIHYLCVSLNGRVIARHKRVSDPRANEKAILEHFNSSGNLLLNNECGYNYKTDKPEEIAESVHRRCREIVAHAERLRRESNESA